MSGDNYDYAYHHVDWFIDVIRDRKAKDRETMPKDVCDLRLMFADHLERVSKAMCVIESDDFGDSVEGSEVEVIKACLNRKDVEE